MGGGKIEGTGGVTPMSVAGRVVRDQERVHGMTAEERAWRMKWIKDQNLSPNEPRHVPAMRQELLNPLRRFYRFPLDFFFNRVVSPVTGEIPANVLRFYTGRGLMGLWGILAVVYYFKYNTNTWQGKGRWRVTESKRAVYPGEEGYPYVSPTREPHEFHDRGFGDSIFGKKFPQYQQK